MFVYIYNQIYLLGGNDMELHDYSKFTPDMLSTLTDVNKNKLIKVLLRDINNSNNTLSWSTCNEIREDITEDIFPYLALDGHSINVTTTLPTSSLITGDNYNLLLLMQQHYKDSIGLMFSAIPDSTVDKSYIYNSEYVRNTDRWSNTKWNSYIYKRLNLMKNILKQSGIIVLYTNSNDLANLTKIMDSVFGASNRIGIITVVCNRGYSLSNGLTDLNKYLVVYARNYQKALNRVGKSIKDLTDSDMLITNNQNKFMLPTEVPYFESEEITEVNTRQTSIKEFADKLGVFTLRDFDIIGITTNKNASSYYSNKQYSLYYEATDEILQVIVGKKKIGKKGAIYDFSPKISIEPTDLAIELIPKKAWRWTIDVTQEDLDLIKTGNNRLVVKYTETTGLTICMKLYNTYMEKFPERNLALKAEPVTNLWDSPQYSTQTATKQFNQLMALGDSSKKRKAGDDIPSISVKLIQDVISTFSCRGDLVVDFFAGNGAVGEAVLELNKLYDRQNRFILCAKDEVEQDIIFNRLSILSNKECMNTLKRDIEDFKLLSFLVNKIHLSGYISGQSDDYINPKMLQGIAGTLQTYFMFLMSLDRCVTSKSDGTFSIWMNTFDRILVLFDLSQLNISDESIIQALEGYTELCGDIKLDDYKCYVVQLTIGSSFIGEELLIGRKQIITETYPLNFIRVNQKQLRDICNTYTDINL